MRLNGGTEPYPEMYQIAVGVSVITTPLNPGVAKTGDLPIGRYVTCRNRCRKVRSILRVEQSNGARIERGHKGSRALRLFVYFMLNLSASGDCLCLQLCKSHAKALMIAWRT